MESENRHEFDVTMETFDHPRYEIIPTGDVFDGEAEVARYFEESRTAFPDQRNELIIFLTPRIVNRSEAPHTATFAGQQEPLTNPIAPESESATVVGSPVSPGSCA